jgi:hypothetical protein
MRKKIITIIAAMSSATSVKATGHEIRPEIADFDMKRWTLSVGRFLQAVIEQEPEHEQDQEYEERIDFVCKKYRPPRPTGVKGGCSPQNNRGKLQRY